MSVLSRILIAGSAGLALIGMAACSGGATGGESGDPSISAAPAAGLETFDPCSFFKSEELTAAGVSPEGVNFSPIGSQPGCKWEGELLDISLQKDAEQPLDKYREGNFDVNDPIDIEGRKAARVIAPGSAGQGICNTVLSAGGGVVILKVTGARRDSLPDPCGEAEEIATQIEPRLPE